MTDTVALHIGEFIRDECRARGWDDDDFLAVFETVHPTLEPDAARLVGELLINVAKPGCVAGVDACVALSATFDTSVSLWINLDSMYHEWHGIDVSKHYPLQSEQGGEG